MGCKILTGYRKNNPDPKTTDSRILADAFSGHCVAMPCQVTDETYIKGKWTYLYRAIDKHGKALEFMLSKRRDEVAARLIFGREIETNGLPSRAVIDKSGANLAGLLRINVA